MLGIDKMYQNRYSLNLKKVSAVFYKTEALMLQIKENHNFLWRHDMNQMYVGSSFDDFIKNENISVEVENEAVKRLIAYGLMEAMKEQKMNKSEMAKKMNTSRSSLDRLLNPSNDSVTLSTLTKAANVLGKKLVLQLQ